MTRHPVLVTLALIWPGQLIAIAGVVSSYAVPQIAIHFRTTQIAWFALVFVLVSVAATPFAMRLGEIYGKRRVMVILTVVGLVGDVLAALAPNFPLMIAGRAIAGVYGPVTPLVLASVRDIFPARRISLVYGVITGSIGLAIMVSPLLAGWLIDAFNWQAVMWAIAASTALALLLITLTPATPRRGTLAGFDWGGGAFLGGGITVLVFGINKGAGWGWTSAATLVTIIVGLLALAAFVVTELRAARPLVDMAMLRRRSAAAVLTGPSIVQGAFFASPAVITFLAIYPAIPHVSDGLGWSVTRTAVVGICAGILTTAAGVAAGQLLRRLPPRIPWFTSTLILVLGLCLEALYHRNAAEIIITGSVAGIGGGMLVTVLGTMIVSVVTPEEQAAANGLTALAWQVFGAISYQLMFVILAQHQVVYQGTAFYLDVAYRNAYFLFAGIVAVGLVLSLALPRIKRPDQVRTI